MTGRQIKDRKKCVGGGGEGRGRGSDTQRLRSKHGGRFLSGYCILVWMRTGKGQKG